MFSLASLDSGIILDNNIAMLMSAILHTIICIILPSFFARTIKFFLCCFPLSIKFMEYIIKE